MTIFKDKKIMRCFKYILPPVLLILIFVHIDISKLLTTLVRIHVGYVVLALVFGYMAFVLASTLRWKLLLHTAYQIRIPYLRLLRFYWIGMFVGYFIPAGLGADIYRAVYAGRWSGEYEKNLVTVFMEKLFILAGSILILLAVSPLAGISLPPGHQVENVLHMLYWTALFGFLGAGIVVGGLATSCGSRVVSALSVRVWSWVQAGLDKVPGGLGARKMPRDLGLLLQPFVRWQSVALIVGFTVLNRLIGCLGGVFLLQAVGVQLSLPAHLFIWTLIFVLFSLPISIGTLGVREGVFIVLLGLFGVSSETALAVSFAGLACLLVTTCTGGLIWIGHNLFTAAAGRQ